VIDFETTDLATVEAVLTTDKGDLVLTFHPEKAPEHVKNFLSLAQQGFYDGLAFHRVIRNFMIQGGCPNTREGATGVAGTGGPGHTVRAEFNDLPHQRGALSAARGQDPDSAGSQFFIVHAEHAEHLDGQYTVFGSVTEGFDVLDQIAGVDVSFGAGGERSTPLERVEMTRIALRIAQPPAEESPAEESGAEESPAGDPGEGDPVAGAAPPDTPAVVDEAETGA